MRRLANILRRSAAIGGRLALVLAAAGALSGAAAARAPSSLRRAAAARAGTGPVTVADSGFSPTRNGYSFANYGVRAGVPNLGPDEMQQLFGSGVCAGFSGGQCVLSPPALAWMTQENEAMADGHCEGFSVTAQFFFAHLSTPTLFGASAVPGLTLPGNQLLAREIAYGYVFQVLDSVRAGEVFGSPRQVLSTLESELHGDAQLYTLGITQPDGSGGHAVTPFAVRRLSADRYAILVYDNNYPGQTRTVMIDTRSDTWSFQAAPTSGQPGSLYTGSATSRSLFLLPTRPGLGVQPCPFCSITTPAGDGTAPTPPSTSTPTTATTATARSRPTASYEAIRLALTGGVGHLLITGARGRRIGDVRGRLVDTIPGARIVSLFVGGARTWLDHNEPEYEVPVGQPYRIELTATGRPRAGPERWRASVTVLEPGFVVAVREIKLGPGRSARLELPVDGHGISFMAPGSAPQAPQLVVGDAVSGANDYQWTAADHGARAGELVSAALDVTARRLHLSGNGSYDMSMDLVHNSVSVFTHDNVPVASGTTVTFNYASWAAGDSMPITDTAGESSSLSDEPAAPGAGDEFAPVESGPAPPEPQPTAMSAGASDVTLICRPGEIVAGDTATCDVDVQGLDSDTAGTPTGEVDFSSDGSGVFSAGSCQLAGGACEVTYTPSAVGSGSHDLTADYRGDGTFASGSDTVTIFVDPRATATSLDCEPQAVAIGAPATCTATVTDTDVGAASTPTGEVEFSSDGDGGFSSVGCQLAAGSCAVTYTPAAVGSGAHDITAVYDGDGVHDTSQDHEVVSVGLRATGIAIDCAPEEVPVGQSTTCTATVSDTSAGSPSTPTGTVSFASDLAGPFMGNPCTLTPSGAGVAGCAVTYTPSDTGADVANLTVQYSGDGAHSASS